MNMKMSVKLILAAMLLAAGLVGKADASVFVSTPSIAGFLAVSTPTASGTSTRLKGCILSNDTAVASCVGLYSNTTLKLQLCAGANASAMYPSGVPTATALSGTAGGLSQLFGEDLSFPGAFIVKGSTPSSSISLTCAYLIK